VKVSEKPDSHYKKVAHGINAFAKGSQNGGIIEGKGRPRGLSWASGERLKKGQKNKSVRAGKLLGSVRGSGSLCSR